ncbi:hypothetical protein EDM56_02080 [Brevibacillus fluminis]|uniref:Uncharacterized protein n=1 Tax=Brevibacillus fluminis TaxID=511487 RepID=A0A3M8DWL3_9BACL|nr:hypothetical protein EDM56_02080 [Brevibacillus fluminis]
MSDDKNMYDCPLLLRSLWMGDCYDINAVLEQMVNKSILKSLESEIGKPIDLSQAAIICPDCSHYNFKE